MSPGINEASSTCLHAEHNWPQVGGEKKSDDNTWLELISVVVCILPICTNKRLYRQSSDMHCASNSCLIKKCPSTIEFVFNAAVTK